MSKISFSEVISDPNAAIDAPPSLSFDPVRWARQNPWLVEGQPDDRKPMVTAGTKSGGSAAAQRSTTRRAHQLEFKTWSKERHD